MKPDRLIAFGILSLSLLTIMSGAAVSPALADIQSSLKGANPTLTKMILTTPAMFIIPTATLVGRYTQGLSKKQMLLTATAVYVVAGSSAYFASDIYMLLTTRALLGIAVGVIMPVSTSLIADYYSGESRMKMMGYNASFANFGGIVATFSSGLLAGIDWRYAFLVYLLGIPIFLIALFFIKDPESPTKISAPKLDKLPMATYLTAFPGFMIFLGFYTIPTNIAVYLVAKGLGGPEHAGYALAFSTGTAMVMGFFAAKVRRALGRAFVPSIALSMLLCHLLLGFTTSTASVNIAMIANGYTLSMSIPYIMMRATESSGGNNVGATSLVTSFIFLGQFFSPLVLDGLTAPFGLNDPDMVYRIVAAGSAAALAFTLLKSFRRPSSPAL
jgi:MFS family permease